MARELARVILFVKDMDRLVAFYRDVIGLDPVARDEDDENFVSLGAGRAQVSLHRIPAAIAESITITDPPDPRGSTPIKVSFLADDVEAARAELVAQGVAMRAIVRFGELALCDGLDPEGNVFQLTNR
jgi:catechol 2,3-dioxygenase-like lactoylglutathione lyase family enzyme